MERPKSALSLISLIKQKYPDLIISYNYDKVDDYYYIWYNDNLLQLNDDFSNFVGDLIRQHLY